MLARIYIGTNNVAAQFPSRVVDFDHYVLERAGGFTRFEADGRWVNSEGKEVYERSLVYEIVAENKYVVGTIALEAKIAFMQEAILVVFIEAESELL